MKPVGRPTIYTPELAEQICGKIAVSNRGLRFICKELGISTDSVMNWLNKYPEFVVHYARAREMQADFLADEILEIADHSDSDTVIIYDKSGKPVPVEDKEWTNRSRLRVDTRKWIASKLKPKKYGDKLDVTQEGQILHNVVVQVVPSPIPIATTEDQIKLD